MVASVLNHYPMEKKPLIVVIEDEKEMAELIASQLSLAGMQVQVYHTAGSGLKFLKNNFANLLLLDVNLPDSSGFALFDEMRQANIRTPVIFLTATDSEVQKVRALDMGGDDFITKPFSFPELIARIRAVLRRAETSQDSLISENVRLSEDAFTFCAAEINPQRLEIRFPNGKTESLGRKEIGIMHYLANNPDIVVSRKQLIHAVWGIHADVRSRSLDQYVVKIRDMFGRHEVSLDSFRTIHGVGYIYDSANSAGPDA